MLLSFGSVVDCCSFGAVVVDVVVGVALVVVFLM